jgi:E3 ubiquitin-protein ligase TRIP12
VLKSNPEVTSRFMRVMMPVLVDVYAASVALRVRTRVLTALLKTMSFLDAEELMVILKVSIPLPILLFDWFDAHLFSPLFLQTVPLASFLGSIMSSRDSSELVLGALQLIELLLTKLPQVYRTSFRREGVMYEIDLLADQELSTAKKAAEEKAKAAEKKEKEKDGDGKVKEEATSTPIPSGTDAVATRSSEAGPSLASDADRRASSTSTTTFPTPKRPSAPLDPQDANILRARVIRVKPAADEADGADPDDEASQVLQKMKGLVDRLNDKAASLGDLEGVVKELADVFGSAGNAISSFELLQSGLVDGLLECATTDGKGQFLPSSSSTSVHLGLLAYMSSCCSRF